MSENDDKDSARPVNRNSPVDRGPLFERGQMYDRETVLARLRCKTDTLLELQKAGLRIAKRPGMKLSFFLGDDIIDFFFPHEDLPCESKSESS